MNRLPADLADLLMAWAANFGVATLKKMSAPDDLA